MHPNEIRLDASNALLIPKLIEEAVRLGKAHEDAMMEQLKRQQAEKQAVRNS